MNTLRRTCFACVALLASHLASADVFYKTGLIKGIYSYDTVMGADAAHFTMDGFYPADTNNTCTAEDGLVGIALRDDDYGKRLFAILLAAQLAGKPVRIRVDNTRKNPWGLCYLWVLERID